jgi:hypothetical protein
LNPSTIANADGGSVSATFSNFNSEDGTNYNPIFLDKTPTGNNRMANITNNIATITFSNIVQVPSFYVNTLVYGPNSGWKVEGKLNGVTQFTFEFNFTFSYGVWGEVIAGLNKNIDSLVFTNAKDIGVDDISVKSVAPNNSSCGCE